MKKYDTMEALIMTLGTPVWEAKNKPSQPGMNGMQRMGYQVLVPKCMTLKIPAFAQITPMTSPKGPFTQVKFYGVEINVYGIEVKAEMELVGMIYMMLKTWFPIEAEDAPVNADAIKNYEFYLKVEVAAPGQQSEGEVVIYNAKKTERRTKHMYQNGTFAHSNDASRNQHIEILTDETDEETFLADRRPRREKAGQPTA